MQALSNKETALLMLLAEQPMHGYKIEQEIENRSMREWTEISTSSIYKLLRKMETNGLVGSKIKLSRNNLSQKVYSMTSAGRKTLKEKISVLISEPEKIIYRIDLATSHLDQLTKQEALNGLRKYKSKLRDNLNGYQQLEKYLIDNKCPKHNLALARRPQHLIEADIEWATAYMDELLT